MTSLLKRRTAVALQMAVSIALIAGPTQAFDPGDNYSGHVYNGGSPRCLDSGTVVNAQLWSCSTSIYQQWSYNTRAGRIIGNSPTGCLDGGAGTNGTPVPLVACNGALNQQWTYDGSFRMVNRASGRCLDANLGTIGGNATKVQIWDCGSGTNQQWYFEFGP